MFISLTVLTLRETTSAGYPPQDGLFLLNLCQTRRPTDVIFSGNPP